MCLKGRSNPRDGCERRGSMTGLLTSVELLRRAQDGQDQALDQLIERYLPPFRRWARHRLPVWARGAMDTDDLVQETLLRTIKNLKNFDPRGDGALQAYLHKAMLNRVRDVMRKASARPVRSRSTRTNRTLVRHPFT
jgi:DNA-directed RNA polymerase specialized sigma24 family protein